MVAGWLPTLDLERSRGVAEAVAGVTPFEMVRQRLEGAGLTPRRAGSQWQARCPAHEDGTASLSVKETPDGKVILKCFADCRTEDVIATLGLEWADLFPGDRKRKAEVVATYDYTDEAGQLLYQAVRYFPKGFRRRRPDGAGGWTWSLKGKDDRYAIPLVLYRLPAVLEAIDKGQMVYVVEGEKDVHAIERAGGVATTTIGGVNGPWPPAFSRILAEAAQITVVADRDAPGCERARSIASNLIAGGADPERVQVVEAAEGKDAYDHFAAGHGLEDFQPLAEAADERAAAERLDAADGSDDDPPTSKQSQATLLVQLAEAARVELFHTPAHEPYARILVDSHRETWPVRSKAFRRFLARLFYGAHGKAAGSQAIQDAIGVLEGKALFEGPERPIAVRVAGQEGAIWLDLGDSRWRAVRITANGWSVVADPPVAFRRPAGMGALPAPEPGGKLEELRQFVNASNESWPLVAGALVMMLRPTGPYPVLNLLGGQGSAKTTTARVLRELVDPNAVELRSEPKDMRDLAIAAANNQVAGFDNLSSIPTWLSDGLCRLATGGGFATRELFSDGEEALFAFQRPVVLTGIEELAVRGDLLDRSILVYLPPIGDDDRRTEEEFWTSYQAARPRLLGALLDAASVALANLGGVKLGRLPRMADFARWVAAAAPALGFKADDFMAAYEGNRSDASRLAVEASPVAQEIRSFAVDVQRWEGTATRLLAALNERLPQEARRARGWPKAANTLTNRLRRDQAALAEVGVRVGFDRKTDATRERIVRLEWVGEASSRPSAASESAADQGRRSDGAMDDGRSEQEGGRSEHGGTVQQRMAVDLRNYGSADGADGADGDSATSSDRPTPGSNGDASTARPNPATWKPAPAPPSPGGVWGPHVRCYGCGDLKPTSRTDYEAGRLGECHGCRRAFEPIDPDREPAGRLA